jgi:hypothetical protein
LTAQLAIFTFPEAGIHILPFSGQSEALEQLLVSDVIIFISGMSKTGRLARLGQNLGCSHAAWDRSAPLRTFVKQCSVTVNLADPSGQQHLGSNPRFLLKFVEGIRTEAVSPVGHLLCWTDVLEVWKV